MEILIQKDQLNNIDFLLTSINKILLVFLKRLQIYDQKSLFVNYCLHINNRKNSKISKLTVNVCDVFF